MKKAAFLAAVACFLFACGQSNPIGENTSVKTYTYVDKEGVELKMDVYQDSTVLMADTKHPVFIFSFGGGWDTGKREDGAAILDDFAQATTSLS